MKKLITLLAAGSTLFGAHLALADDATTSTNTPPAHHQMTAQQRHEHMDKLLKALDLNPAVLKGLTREERQAKIKATAEKVSADLKAKKAAGTITAEEQKNLTLIENALTHATHHKAGETGADSSQ